MTQVPAIYVLAGVNGSGKSSIGGAAFRSRGVEYYNPYEAARQIRSIHPSMTQAIANGHAWTLGRDLLVSAIVKQQTFVFETTLGGTTITDHVEPGRIVNPEDFSGAPEWAKPIIAAAMVAYEGR